MSSSKMGTKSGEMRLESLGLVGSDLTVAGGKENSAFFFFLTSFLSALGSGSTLIKLSISNRKRLRDLRVKTLRYLKSVPCWEALSST